MDKFTNSSISSFPITKTRHKTIGTLWPMISILRMSTTSWNRMKWGASMISRSWISGRNRWASINRNSFKIQIKMIPFQSNTNLISWQISTKMKLSLNRKSTNTNHFNLQMISKCSSDMKIWEAIFHQVQGLQEALSSKAVSRHKSKCSKYNFLHKMNSNRCFSKSIVKIKTNYKAFLWLNRWKIRRWIKLWLNSVCTRNST